jgi:uncharacterized protein
MREGILSRRHFLRQSSTGLGVAGMAGLGSAAFGNSSLGLQAKTPPPPQASLQGVLRVAEEISLKPYHIWDCHCHMEGFEGTTPTERMADMLHFADRMDIERFCTFLGFPFNFRGTAEQMREQNDQVLEAVRHSDVRAFGYAYMNPNHPQACLDELNRCVRDGPMIGLKFELGQPQCADTPEMDAIIARAGELKAVVMHHTWIKTMGNEVGESTPMDLVRLARRHPSVTIFCAHMGGNWELGIRAIRDVKNVYGDLCGSDPTAGYTEMAIRELGADRVLYGSDVGGRSFASQLGKVMAADIPDSTRHLVLGENLRRLLQPVLQAKGVKV